MWTESLLVRDVLDTLGDGLFFVDLEGRITFWNEAAESITGLTGAETMGRTCSELLLHVDTSGRPLCEGGCLRPCADCSVDGWTPNAFLRHREGHRVPVALRVSPLRDEAGSVIGSMELFSDLSNQMEAMKRARELERLAHVDTLTEVGNRRSGEKALRSRLSELERYGTPFGVVMLDADDFKRINDDYGHLVGDEALKTIAGTLLRNLRNSDVVVRWAGEEFLVILPGVDPLALAKVAGRFCRLVADATTDTGSGSLWVTISAGGTMARAGERVEELLARADRLMYESKRRGKNRATVDDPSEAYCSGKAVG